ncbi:MAG TPA: (R)-hydratase [Rhodospirillaceae bacterium]|nr:(R)-hydratase [Rhodospirillaceae bacterium]HAA93491.1 (R)-hydratase [Rhodospirillaceae bacterium]HAT34782.1 (R)-hydratase [Rhodospirillaceae bacterium]
MDAARSHSDLHGYFIEDLTVGMSASYAKTITEADIVIFAGISGDNNPLHLNEEFASESIFKGRIAHGMLTAVFISTVLGTKLPGPGCVYLTQDVKFKAPVRPGDTVNTTVTITDVIRDKKRVIAQSVCKVGDKVVVEGNSMLLVPSREDA